MGRGRGGGRPEPVPFPSAAIAIGLVVTLLGVAAGCGPAHRPNATSRLPVTSAPNVAGSTTTTSGAGPSSLVVEASTEAELTDNFNPFASHSPLNQMGVPSYIYEPLVEYNELSVDQYYPWLAQSWSFSSSGLSITFDLRPGVKWDDGSKFTAADAAYTFNLLKTYPSINDGIPIVSAVAPSPTTFTLTLSQPGYAYLYDIARTPIVKQGYASTHGPVDYVDTDPDGTGPYTLAPHNGFSASRVVLTARSGYWQTGQPAIHQLVFPAYPSNGAVLSALQAGTLDWADAQFPDVQGAFVDRDKSTNHYWAPPVDCIALELNLQQTDLGKLDVRRAISAAIDRDAVSQQADDGLDPPATTASGLVLPIDKQFLVASDSGDIDGTGNLSQAAALMKAAGYHSNAAGYWANASNQVVRLGIEDPTGTVFAAAATAVAEQLRSAGFDATARVISAAQWHTDLADGHFVASILASASGPSPFYMYEEWLDSSLVVDGHAAGDYERLDPATAPALNAAVSADLDDYTDSLSDSSGAQAAIRALAEVVDHDLPVVPLLYGAAWAEFSTRHASGWPDNQDPYEPAAPRAPFAEYTVLQLSPSSP